MAKDWGKRVLFIGGLQVIIGNTNLMESVKIFVKLEFEGLVGRYPTLTTTGDLHNYNTFKCVLVEKCDYTSTVGWGNGDPKAEKS